ncbi:GNAT family N-acetyltransferase [Pseudoalteromonas sp. JBTF-M23]|uniref:GNAT family N-acetyltransferase n=1 Tax=Pseudoalteromonas caenipelagi TaxID=2726988 RepID=A0A849VDF2_9GAMM|nr:GNAT family protein [Pseudoalteromonas caenipelagi]NOU49721.1 GNAT family N-acetyltransferase [Pseudoalteromonas caenipelagi]
MAPTLYTKHMQIRPFFAKDLAHFAQYRNIKDVARYQSWDNYTLADAQRLFDNMDYTTFGEAGKWFQLAIVDSSSDHLLGDLAIHFIDDEQVEIGFTIAPTNQRQGVANNAVTALLEYLFNVLSKHRVIAITDAKNEAAQRLLKCLGFRLEAHYMQNIFFKGEWADECLYAMLASEFNSSVGL